MDRASKTHWKALRVRADEPGDLGVTTAPLAALYRLEKGDAPCEATGVDETKGRVISDAHEVDWSGFPEIGAMQAVFEEELSRMRALFGMGTGSDRLHP